MSNLPGFNIDPITARLPNTVKVYVVGGAVRDLLLGRPASDKDWVVVGADAHDMERAGFTAVGSDFPVFLHPVTKQEYALARTERKSGHGYKGFTFYANKEVTLEQDLLRRDFTINAMAMSADGELIDPYSGQADLQVKLFRHVSDSFSEDPLRVLRLARFLARFDQFEVADKTLALCQYLANSGELGYLVPERVFVELDRAMGESVPSRAWAFLEKLGAWKDLCSSAPGAWQQVDAQAEITLNSSLSKMSKWFWWLAKAGDRAAIAQISKEMKIPNELRDGAVVWSLIAQFSQNVQRQQVTDSDWLDLLSQVDVYRKADRLGGILEAFGSLEAGVGVQNVLQELVDQVLSGGFKSQQKQYLDAHPELLPAQAVNEFRLLWLKKALS